MFDGVFVPCCLCIFGVILYQRLGWIVGQAGIGQVLIMLFVGYMIVITTALSLSALSTNGLLRGGGAYYLVSRALGPELGGAIGVIFYAANLCGCVVYLLGFAAELGDILYGEGNYGRWIRTLFALSALIGVTIICYIGPQLYAKTAVTAFTCTCVVLTISLVSFLSQKPGATDGFTGLKASTFSSTWKPHYSDGNGFSEIFAILFPAVTGIMAGANMSGVLKEPSKAIPKGTLAATFGSSIVYLAFALIIGASNTAEVLSTKKGYTVLRRVAVFPPAVSAGVFLAVLMSTMGTQIGAAQILLALANDKLLPFLSVFRPSDHGEGSSNDETDEGDIDSSTTDDSQLEMYSRRAVLATFTLIAILVLCGFDLNTMATFQTLFFLLSYAIINLACFLLSIQGSVNFRPIWKHYSWHMAGFGFVACIGVMFFIHPLRAAVALLLLVVLVFYLMYAGPDTSASWGDVTQSLIFHQVRKFLLRLDETKQHLKFWRPHILLIAEDCERQYNLIHFANNVKKGGILVIGDVICAEEKGDGRQRDLNLSHFLIKRLESRRRAWGEYIKACKLKAFPSVTASHSMQSGIQQLLMMVGLGALRPNTVLLEFLEEDRKSSQTFELSESLPQRVQEIAKQLPVESPGSKAANQPGQVSKPRYLSILRDILAVGHNLLLARNFQKLPHYLVDGSKPTQETRLRSAGKQQHVIDVWLLEPLESSGSSSGRRKNMLRCSQDLAILLGWILHKCRGSTSGWSRYARLRVLAFTNTAAGADEKRDLLLAYLEEARVVFDELKIVPLDEIEMRKDSHADSRLAVSHEVRVLNAAMRRESHGSALAVIPFTFSPPSTFGEENKEASPEPINLSRDWQRVEALTSQMKCPILLCQGQTSPMVTEL